MVKIADVTILAGEYVGLHRKARFAELLASSGLTLAEFAARVGKRPATVARWGEKVPGYAIAYLEALVLLGGKS